MQRKKTLLLISIANIVISIGYLTKLTIDLINNKKKIEDLYLELAFAISVLMLSVITTILLAKETKHEKLERSDSSLSLSSEGSIENDSDSEEEIEVGENNEESSRISTNDNNAVNNYNTTPNNKKVKEDNSKHHSIINEPQDKKCKKDQIAAITLHESYLVEKYKLEGGKCEILSEDKNGIITSGHKYELVDLQLKEDGTCIITLQNQQDKDVFLKLKSNKIYMHAKEAFVKSNAESSKEVKNYLQGLKANNDIIILLKKPSKGLGFLEDIVKFVADKLDWVHWNDQGMAIVEGKKIYENFKVNFLEKEKAVKVSKKIILKIFSVSIEIKNVLVDITVNNHLIHKEPEVVQKPADNTNQVLSTQIADLSNKDTITANAKIHSPSQPEADDRKSVISDSIETRESTELTEDDNKKQDGEQSPSRNRSSSQSLAESTDSTGKRSGNSLVKKATNKVKNVGDKMEQGAKKCIKIVKDKFVKPKDGKKSEETSLLSSMNEVKTEQAVGVHNQSFVEDEGHSK